MTVNNAQDNAPIERANQVIYNTLVAKDIDNKYFDYIYLWGENLAYIELEIRASYYHDIEATLLKSVFGR